MEDKIRGHLFNIIVYTHEPKKSTYFQHVVQPFIEKYPCRAIFIEGDLTSPRDYLEKEIENGTDTYDQLRIRVSSSRLFQVPFVILPHLVPDLPIYLVWGQDPDSDLPILSQLQKLATRFIYDANCSHDLASFSRKMLKKFDQLPLDLMDIEWAKVSGWRDVIAQVFHSQKELGFLRKCCQLLIKYNPPHDIEAIFLQGWLAAQLEWNFQSLASNEHTQTIHYRDNSQSIHVTLLPQERPTLREGRIFEVAFDTTDHVTMTLSLMEKQSKVMVYLSTPEKCELPFSFPISDMEKRSHAMKEIFYHRTSEHYRHLLRLLGEIEWKKETTAQGALR